MRFIRGLFYLILLIALLIGGLFIGARFSDGPIAVIPGGPLKSGEMVTEPVTDWSFVTDINEIEMQLVAQSTSRITWVVAYEGRAFIPVSLSFPPGKNWHYTADEDGAAILRIDGKKYPVQLTRLKDQTDAEPVFEVLRGKYPPPPGSEGGEAWLFEITSRAP